MIFVFNDIFFVEFQIVFVDTKKVLNICNDFVIFKKYFLIYLLICIYSFSLPLSLCVCIFLYLCLYQSLRFITKINPTGNNNSISHVNCFLFLYFEIANNTVKLCSKTSYLLLPLFCLFINLIYTRTKFILKPYISFP